MIRGLMLYGTVLALVLAGCARQPGNEVDALDNSLLAGNQAATANDPALRSALRDQIMVDPALVQQANDDAIRPAVQPPSAAVPPEQIATRTKPAEQDQVRAAPPPTVDCPQCAAAKRALTLGALAATQGGPARQCAPRVQYSAAWANKLPAGVPLYPDARVSEAAGADAQTCALRVVSFASAAPMKRLIDWYYTKTTAAGFAAQHRSDGVDHVLAGTKPGAAYMAIMRARSDGGTDVDLMADGG